VSSYTQRTWALRRKDAEGGLVFLFMHSENTLFQLAPELMRHADPSLSLHFSELSI